MGLDQFHEVPEFFGKRFFQGCRKQVGLLLQRDLVKFQDIFPQLRHLMHLLHDVADLGIHLFPGPGLRHI